MRIKPRKKKVSLEELVIPPINDKYLQNISQSLSKQIEKETFEKKCTPAFEVLKLVGAGAFLAASIALPTLPMAIKPFLNENNEYEAYSGKRKILRFALDELAIQKPKTWDGKWRLISYDIPGNSKQLREIFREYLRAWGFYPLQESVFLHAYPCLNQVEFLREYLGIGEYVRLFHVAKIENDRLFRDFFGV